MRIPKRRPRRRRRSYSYRMSYQTKQIISLLTAAVVILAALLPASLYLRKLMSQFGVANSRDALIIGINETINQKMSAGDYGYGYFVNLEKDSSGNITALTSNMARINALSSELIHDIVTVAESGEFDLSVPLGNLIGSNLLSGRGPRVPVKVVMLTSSYADFRNDFSSAGINQTKHQIVLEMTVDVDILIPWDSIRTTVRTEILIAETVIVGKVPDTYLQWG